MIVRMRALSAVLYHRDRDAFLSTLQAAGVVHVAEKADRDTTEFFRRMETLKDQERVLKELAAVPGWAAVQKDDKSPSEVIAAYRAILKAQEALHQSGQRLEKDEARLLPWGDFNPAILRTLREKGLFIRFFKAPVKRFNGMGASAGVFFPVRATPSHIYFVAVLDNDGPPPFEADEERLPEASLKEVRDEMALLRRKLEANESARRALAAYTEVLRAHCSDFRNRHGLMNAMENLAPGADGKLLCLQGFFPAETEPKIRKILDRLPVWYETSDPAPGSDVPIQLKNGWFARKLEPVLGMLSLPSYYEIDPVPFFAPFLVLFIGLCLGDVAYGSVLLLVSLAGVFKGPVKFKPVFELVAVIALVVIAAGLAMNSFFGVSLLKGNALLLSPLGPFEENGEMVYPMMSFAIVLGILQVFLAIFLKTVNAWRQSGFISAIFPFASFPIFFGFLVWGTHLNLFGLGWEEFSVGQWRVGALWKAVPSPVGQGLFWSGAALFFLFNNPGTIIFLRPLRGLWEGFNFITGMLSSILSYLRLFALGLSSGLLAAAFNGMAESILLKNGVPDYSSPMIIASIVILVLGHTVNFGLSLISAIIHPLRLTFVEFLFNNLGFSGGGKAYQPLKKNEQSIQGGL